MIRPLAPIGLTIDNRYHITSLTPEVARQSGAYIGMRAGANRKLPWIVTRHYLEALERCFDSGLAVGWYEEGVDGKFACYGQAFPLPMKRGLLVTSMQLDQVPKAVLQSLLEGGSGASVVGDSIPSAGPPARKPI